MDDTGGTHERTGHPQKRTETALSARLCHGEGRDSRPFHGRTERLLEGHRLPERKKHEKRKNHLRSVCSRVPYSHGRNPTLPPLPHLLRGSCPRPSPHLEKGGRHHLLPVVAHTVFLLPRPQINFSESTCTPRPPVLDCHNGTGGRERSRPYK